MKKHQPLQDRESSETFGPSSERTQSGGNQQALDMLRQRIAAAGGSLPHREAAESAFGADLGAVGVWLGAGSELTAMGMNAAATPDGLAFSSSSPDQETVFHEVAHHLQYAGGGGGGGGDVSTPGDAAETEAERAAASASRGDSPAIRQSPQAGLHADWGITNAIGDALNMRSNEAQLDEWEDYQAARAARDAFATEDHATSDFQSETGLGYFDAMYCPVNSKLYITVNCRFSFHSGEVADYPTADPATLQWVEADKDQWKNDWMSQSSSTWSGHHTFYCQEDWWEGLTAEVSVLFKEVESGEHYHCEITKIPPGEFRTSSVRSGRNILGFRSAGTGNFDSEDMVPKRGAHGQIGAVHEAGHMLGLDDEYEGPCTDHPDHSHMADEALGDEVDCGDDGRIMSTGNNIQPEHGVTFLAAITEATGKEWGYTAKEARRMPMDPNNREGDFSLPADPSVAHA